MSAFIDLIFKRYINPYYVTILIVVFSIVFILLGYYSYNEFYVKKLAKKEEKQFSDVANADNRKKELIIYFFHVDWCPHCKTAKPIWDDFSKKYDNTVKKEYKILCLAKNCTEENSEITGLINEYGINSYPTIKMLKDGKKIEFDSKITSDTLDQFVTSMV